MTIRKKQTERMTLFAFIWTLFVFICTLFVFICFLAFICLYFAFICLYLHLFGFICYYLPLFVFGCLYLHLFGLLRHEFYLKSNFTPLWSTNIASGMHNVILLGHFYYGAMSFLILLLSCGTSFYIIVIVRSV